MTSHRLLWSIAFLFGLIVAAFSDVVDTGRVILIVAIWAVGLDLWR